MADLRPAPAATDALTRAALDALPFGMAIFDAAGRCSLWNARYQALWAAWGVRLTPGEALADLLRAGVEAGRYPEAAEQVDDWIAGEIARLANGATEALCEEFGERLRCESRLVAGGGRVETWFTINTATPQGAHAVAQGFLDTIVENVPTMLFVKDGETGRFLLANRAAEQALGVPRSELLGKNDADFFPPEQAEFFAAYDRAVMASGKLVTIDEEPLDTPHNGRRWLHTRKIAVPFQDGQRHLLTICEDITDRKASAAALAEALKRAEAASVAKSEFLANMSHEIRTPLNGIIGMADVLSRTPLNDSQRDMMRVVLNSGRTLNVLLSDILDLSKIEAGGLELADEPLDLREAVTAAVAVFEAVAQEKGVGFSLDFADGFRDHVRGDALRIRQVVANLTSNAIKFTSEGEVRIAATTRTDDDGRTILTVTVADSGDGFDAEVGERLFERFKQADGSVTRKVGGTGLGLPIARQLARGMGGDVTWSAIRGEGATFTFEARLTPAHAPVITSPANDIAGPALPEDRRLQVLLAEDHPTNRKVVMLMLAPLADVTIAVDGHAAVQAFEDGAFDVVLMDTQMPVMDGLEATAAIRRHEARLRRPRTPVISLTANAMPHQVQACLAAGADLHLAKPITVDGLFAALGAALDGPTTAQAPGVMAASV